jgi:hypothetical protein
VLATSRRVDGIFQRGTFLQRYTLDSPRSRWLQQKNSLLKHPRHLASRRWGCWRCWRQVVESASLSQDVSVRARLPRPNCLCHAFLLLRLCNISSNTSKFIFYCCQSSGGTLSLAVESACSVDFEAFGMLISAKVLS